MVESTTSGIPLLHTKRLVLRPDKATDLEVIARMYEDPDVIRYVSFGKPASRSSIRLSAAKHLGHWRLLGYGKWIVEEASTNQIVGRVGLYQPEGWPGFEVGWMIGRPYRQRGFATEAATAAAQYAFDNLTVDRIISLIEPDNTASQRVARRLGERVTGEVRYQGTPMSVHAVTREEWNATTSMVKAGHQEFAPIQTVTTAHCILRPFTSRDLDAVVSLYRNENHVPYGPQNRPTNRAAAWTTIAAYLGEWTLEGYGSWALADRETGTFIGHAGLFVMEGEAKPEFGYVLSSSHQHLRTEIAQLGEQIIHQAQPKERHR